jgi:hypothetical protein
MRHRFSVFSVPRREGITRIERKRAISASTLRGLSSRRLLLTFTRVGRKRDERGEGSLQAGGRALRAMSTEDYRSWTSASPMMATPKAVDE